MKRQAFELSKRMIYLIGIKLFAHEQNEKLVKFDIKFRYQHKSSDFIFIIIIKKICFFI